MSTALTEKKSRLRFVTCGGVGAGKSTLLGRLLYDSNFISEDQVAALTKDSAQRGAAGDEIDFALLVDGVKAEQEQRTTIDVAYRLFSTSKREFVAVDTPGHEKYTRNLAIGASNSELAVILVNAKEGVLAETQRHAYIVSRLGIRNIVLAVNEMDLVDFSHNIFENICSEFSNFAGRLNFEKIVPIPISARNGDNVVQTSEKTPWYDGPCLLAHLEAVEVEAKLSSGPFRMPVQWVIQPNSDHHGFSGTIVRGQVAQGDAVAIAKSGQVTRVKQVIVTSGEVKQAITGQVATITLDEELDISQGDVLVDPKARPEYADQFAAHLLWMSEEELLPHRQYLIKIGAQVIPAHVSQLKHKVDVHSLEHLAARTLQLNEIGYCNFSTDEPVAFDPYSENRDMGGFTVIDSLTHNTVGTGMIAFGLRRATNVHWQALDVNAGARAELKHQKPCMLWFTGLSGSGKSTIANLVEQRLFAQGRHTYILDGDNVRHGLNQDLGFTDGDRVENIRRVTESAKLFVDAGLIVLVSFISPFRSERRLARDSAKEGEFIEIFVDTPIEVCITRDPKGLYKRAQAGEIKNFTGLDSPYEVPENAELVLKTEDISAEDVAERVVSYLRETGRVP